MSKGVCFSSLAAAWWLLTFLPVSAMTVIDPTNLVQNTLTAVRTLEQINNQVEQLQNESQMLVNQARNLASLDYDVVNRLRASLVKSEQLIAEAQGLAFDVQTSIVSLRGCIRKNTQPPLAAIRCTGTLRNVGPTRSVACIRLCVYRRRFPATSTTMRVR